MDLQELCAELLWDIRQRTAGGAKLIELQTNSAYIAPRFCTRCCREWGSLDVLLDIKARRTGAPRHAIWKGMLDDNLRTLRERQAKAAPTPAAGALPEPDLRGPCCTTCALSPQQHVICDEWGQALHLIKSDLGGPQPSKVSVGARRPFPAGTGKKTELPTRLEGAPTLSSIEGLLSATHGPAH